MIGKLPPKPAFIPKPTFPPAPPNPPRPEILFNIE